MNQPIDIASPSPLLGGLSPQTFMRRHWQKKPLLIRQAISNVISPLSRSEMLELAQQDGIESRLIQKHAKPGRKKKNATEWTLRHGPMPEVELPPLSQPGWTLLLQGMDLHVAAAHHLLSRFRFLPDARLDDLMMSFATDGGGVGPHFDSYDVFLLQVHGRRRWQIGPVGDPSIQPELPLKILSNFQPEEEWVLEPGDMLYLPPKWAHDGVAEGECITCSIGFRAASKEEFGREVLQRLLDAALDVEEDNASGIKQAAIPHRAKERSLYKDPNQSATQTPGYIPPQMKLFADEAVARLVSDPQALACALGEWLSEPKPAVWFEERDDELPASKGVGLDQKTRMLYDDRYVFINGESYRAAGRDATLMRRLSDQRRLSAADRARLSQEANLLLEDWVHSGWLHPLNDGDSSGEP